MLGLRGQAAGKSGTVEIYHFLRYRNKRTVVITITIIIIIIIIIIIVVAAAE